MSERNALGRLLLIASLAIIFGFFGINKFMHPLVWIGWIPPWTDGLLGISKDVWLRIVGFMEILIAFLLVVPIRRLRQMGAGLAILELLGILSQVGFNDIGARDFGLLINALALLALL
ncbi:MAG: hypothetical protein AAB489_01765 [Patescibacteria group bacterium]